MVRQAEVYPTASIAAQPVGQIEAGVRVSVFGRKGGWKEIFSEQAAITGWVRVFEVREGSYAMEADGQPQEDSRGFLAGLASISRKASGFFSQDSGATSSSTATIGVRGLSEIESAQADFDELKKMNNFASSQKRVTVFATVGGLKAGKVPHISGLKE